MDSETWQKIKESGIVAVFTPEDPADAVPLAKSLFEGGVTAMKVSQCTPVAIEAVTQIVKSVPKMLVGVDTVLTIEHVDAVVAAKADFGFAPGTNPRIIAYARKQGLPFAPGIAIPSDIDRALEQDCTVLKYFPAESLGGLKHLKNLADPYAHLGVEFIALGGLNIINAENYLIDPIIAAIGAPWLAPRELIKKGDWKSITASARYAMALVQRSRK